MTTSFDCWQVFGVPTSAGVSLTLGFSLDSTRSAFDAKAAKVSFCVPLRDAIQTDPGESNQIKPYQTEIMRRLRRAVECRLVQRLFARKCWICSLCVSFAPVCRSFMGFLAGFATLCTSLQLFADNFSALPFCLHQIKWSGQPVAFKFLLLASWFKLPFT